MEHLAEYGTKQSGQQGCSTCLYTCISDITYDLHDAGHVLYLRICLHIQYVYDLHDAGHVL